MKILIQAPDIKLLPELETFIQEKLDKLDKFSDEIIEGRVILKTDKSDVRENKICEIRLVVPGNDLFASRQSKSFEESAAEAIEALKKQIETRKNK